MAWRPGAPLHAQPRSLYERDPLLVWQAIAAVLAACLLLTLAAGR